MNRNEAALNSTIVPEPLGAPLHFRAIRKGEGVILQWERPPGKEVEGYIISAGPDWKNLKSLEIIESREQSFRLVLDHRGEGEVYAVCSYLGSKSSQTVYATTAGPYSPPSSEARATEEERAGVAGGGRETKKGDSPNRSLDPAWCSCCSPPRHLEEREGEFFCPGHPEVKYVFRKRKEKESKEENS